MLKEIVNSIDINALIAAVIAAVLIPMIKIMCNNVTEWLDAKKEQVLSSTKNEIATKYISEFTKAVKNAVIATNQTFVDDLKKMDKFDQEAWETAFQKSKDTALASLSQDAKKIITESVGDFDKYVDMQIQAAVSVNKTEPIQSATILEAPASSPAVVINATKLSIQDTATGTTATATK